MKKRVVISFTVFIFCIITAFTGDYYIGISFNTSLNRLTEIMLSSLITFAGIWISCFFLLLQFYKNRYPFEIISKNILSIVSKNLIKLCSAFIYGSILVGYGKGVITQLLFTIISVLIIIDILITTYKMNKNLMINTYIDDYVKSIEYQLKKSILNKDSLDEIFIKMEHIFEECITKSEFYICQHISKQVSSIFKVLILEGNRLILENDSYKEQVDYFYSKIITYSLYQVELTKDMNADFLTESLITQHRTNLMVCIDTNQFHLFKKYIDKLNSTIYTLQKNEYLFIVSYLYDMYKFICKTIIQNKNQDDWIKYLIDETLKMNISLNYIHKDTNLKNFISLITYSLVKCLNHGNEETYTYLIDKFALFSTIASTVNHKFDDMTAYYAYLSSELIEKGDIPKIKQYIDILDDIQYNLICDARWIDYIFYFYSTITEKWNNEFADLIREKNVTVLLSLISSDVSSCGNLMLPNFKKLVKINQYNQSEIKKICSDFYLLMSKCIIKNNPNMFYIFTNELSECLTGLEKQSKEVQQMLFDVFIDMLSKTATSDRKDFTQIIFSQLEDVIVKLDIENKISDDFGSHIIDKLSEAAKDSHTVSKILVCDIVQFIYGFLKEEKEMSFVIRKTDKIKQIIRTIYTIGLSCIENNNEESLRTVSNAIGWIIIGSIKRGQNSLTIYALERATSLFDISKSMNISEKTLAFIMTLFTTIGTYCCKEASLMPYRQKIINSLQNENIDLIKTAIKLRTSESDTWNKLFENKTESLTRTFLAGINECRKISSEQTVAIIKH